MVAIIFITFIAAVVKNLSEPRHHGDRRRSIWSTTSMNSEVASQRSLDSLPPGAKPRPTQTIDQYKEIGRGATRQHVENLVNSEDYKRHQEGLRNRFTER